MNIYHGTNTKKAYLSILKNGFREGTYFTEDLTSAISMGGKHIFCVDLGSELTYWEYISDKVITPDKIKHIQKYKLKLLYYNRGLHYNIKKKEIESEGNLICNSCSGKGEHRKLKHSIRYLKQTGGASFRTRKDSVKVCTTCRGYGCLDEKGAQL